MQPITYEKPETVEAAVEALGRPDTVFVLGGTTVFDLMKVNVIRAQRAADVAFAGARAHSHNQYKIPLGKQTLVRALLDAAAMEI